MIGTRYHTCGAKLTVTWKWNGRKHVMYLLDEHGDTTNSCPGCGEYIYGNEFLIKPPEREEA